MRSAQREDSKCLDGLGMFTELSIKAGESLRRKLGVEEGAYLAVAGHTWQDARAYVVYTSLDEVDKSVVYGLMTIPNLLREGGDPFSPRSDRIDRIFITQFLEQLQSRMRRDLEILVNLVLFSETNEQSYYRHFLLLEELTDLLSANSDLEEFYGSRSGNLDDTIARLVGQIRQIEAEIDLNNCWYLPVVKPLDELTKLRPGRVFNSIRSRLKLALPLMSDHEKAMSRFSYRRYGQLSKAVHYVANRHDFQLDADQLLVSAAELGITCFCILDRCRTLLGLTSSPIPDKISRSLKQSSPRCMVQLLTLGEAAVGDIVLAHGDLAEVLEVSTSEYGYRSYRVRYLAEKPKTHIQEDWFPASSVRRVYTRKQLLASLGRLAEEGKVSSDIVEQIGKLSQADLQRIMRESVVEMWHVGLRDWMNHRRNPKNQ